MLRINPDTLHHLINRKREGIAGMIKVTPQNTQVLADELNTSYAVVGVVEKETNSPCALIYFCNPTGIDATERYRTRTRTNWLESVGATC